jgi:hypothetical protein
MTQLDLDHGRFIANQTYRREVIARLRRLINEERISRMTIVHEVDNSCCRSEPWSVTYTFLLAALWADGERVLGVVL